MRDDRPVESTSGVVCALVGLIASVIAMGSLLVVLSNFLSQS